MNWIKVALAKENELTFYTRIFLKKQSIISYEIEIFFTVVFNGLINFTNEPVKTSEG